MKRGAARWRVRDACLIFLVLVCTTLLIWTWDTTFLHSTFLPPKTKLLVLPTDNIREVPETNKVPAAESRRQPKDESSLFTEEVSLDNKDEKNIPKQSPETKESHSYVSTTSIENEETGRHVSNLLKDRHKKEEEKQESKLMVGESDGEQKQEDDEKNSEEGKKTFDIRDNDTSTMQEESKACNYVKGKWIVDTRRPLYSGFGCKQWLASMWACRMMQREDFAYENLRWQPKDCEIDEFEGSKFLTRMRNKTLAFVGDSLGRQQFQSLMCMITGGKERSDVLDVGPEYGLVVPAGGARPNGWAYRFPETNTTVLYHWSSTLCDIEPINITNPTTDYAMHLDRPPAFLLKYLHKIHVLVLNTGHHWNRGKLRGNRWVMHVGGVPNTNRKLAALGDAKNFTIHSIISWVNSQIPGHPDLKAFYRSISPRHFVGGDWNTGGSCNNTTPMSIGKEVLQDESSDYSAGHAAKGTGVKLLDITALSQVRDEGHISRFSLTASSGVQDCLHWCLPGVPDTWNEILFAQI